MAEAQCLAVQESAAVSKTASRKGLPVQIAASECSGMQVRAVAFYKRGKNK
jgi:hypothetical protein